MKARPFDLAYDVIADYASYFTQYCEGRRFRHVPIVVASIAPAGYSERKLWRRTFERWRLVRRHRPTISTDFFYAKLIVTQILPLQLRRLVKGGLMKGGIGAGVPADRLDHHQAGRNEEGHEGAA